LREVSDTLDLANIQDDILQRIKGDSRVTAEARPNVLAELDGRVLNLDEVRELFELDLIIAYTLI